MTAGAKTSSVFCQLDQTKVIFAPTNAPQRQKLSDLVFHSLKARHLEGEFDKDEGRETEQSHPVFRAPRPSNPNSLRSPTHRVLKITFFFTHVNKQTASGAVISTSGTRPWLLTLFSAGYVTFDSGAHCLGLFGFFRQREEAGGTDTGKSLSHPEDIPPAFPTGTQRNGAGD